MGKKKKTEQESSFFDRKGPGENYTFQFIPELIK